ncbi:MAG: transporter substrate-binding domain-containing protein [Leptolyngbyaceae cyanobacterium]
MHRGKRLSWLVTTLSIVGVAGSLLFAPLLVSAADLQTIRQRGRLIVAVKDNLRPLGFRDGQGQLQGLEIDLARQLAQDILGRSDAVEFRPVTNADRFPAVLNGEVDVAIANITLTPSRLRILNFSLPYYTTGAALITRDPAIRQVADLRGKAIAVLNGTTTVEVLRRQLPDAKLVGVTSYEAARAAIETDTVAAVAADTTVLTGWVQESPQYRQLLPVLSSELLGVVLPKGQQYADLQGAINQTIARLKANGWLEQRAKYWGLPQ